MRAIGRNFGLLMTGFVAVLIAGFWIPYFSGLPHFDPDISAAMHLHAAALFGWSVVMLIQPVAIYANARRLHRSLGTLSVGVMALVVLTSLAMLHKEYLERIQGGTSAGEAMRGEYLSSAQLLLLVSAYVFSVIAARRRQIAVHWRLIVCIILLLLPAGLARTMGYWFQVPQVKAQSVCVAVNLVVLATLTILDMRARRHRAVYASALATYSVIVAGWLMLGRPV